MSFEQGKAEKDGEQTDAFAVEFSEFRHKLFNSLAVMMALAEMGRVDPAKFPRLAEVVLEKGNDLKESMLALTKIYQKEYPDSACD